MPTADAIMWSAIAGLILIMLGIIASLLNRGFEGLKEQLKTLWDKLDQHQRLAELNSREIAEMQARCSERHK